MFISGRSAWEPHLNFGTKLAEKLAPSLAVELGVFCGDSLAAFCHGIASSNTQFPKVYGIDKFDHALNGDEIKHRQDNQDYLSAQKAIAPYSFAHLVVGTFKEHVNMFAYESIDLLHIDGDHSLEAVTDDWTTYEPKVNKERSIVLFHDIHVTHFGVKDFWRALPGVKMDIADRHNYGLGVLGYGFSQSELANWVEECCS